MLQTEGRGSFQQNTFTHMLLANLSAYYPKLCLFLPLAVICLVRHMACPGYCILTAELGILGDRLPTKTRIFPLTHCTPSSFQLWDCIPNPHAPLLSPFPHLCLDAFPLHYETSLYHTFFETVMGTMNGVCEYQSNIQFISRPEH